MPKGKEKKNKYEERVGSINGPHIYGLNKNIYNKKRYFPLGLKQSSNT